jgi:hypothetical protein
MPNYEKKLIIDLVTLEEQEKPVDNWRVPYDYVDDRPYLQLPAPPPPEKDESKKEAAPEEKRVIIIDL